MENSLANIFIPKPDIQNKISSIVGDWDDNVIGLHIRRTDNIRSIHFSPISHFYDVIDKEIANNRNVRFYVATDDVSVKQAFISKYGPRIISPQLCLKRYCLQGMKDAVVDLFCLARTSKIYGSEASTYSSFASKLYNKELII